MPDTRCFEDILNGEDYYPFGMGMPARDFSAGSDYKYGFNGKISDDETYGSGNVYDYGFRIYNPRLGKFLSVDPLTGTYPWYTPYQFAGNDPINFIDIDGLEKGRNYVAPRNQPVINNNNYRNTNTNRPRLQPYERQNVRYRTNSMINYDIPISKTTIITYNLNVKPIQLVQPAPLLYLDPVSETYSSSPVTPLGVSMTSLYEILNDYFKHLNSVTLYTNYAESLVQNESGPLNYIEVFKELNLDDAKLKELDNRWLADKESYIWGFSNYLSEEEKQKVRDDAKFYGPGGKDIETAPPLVKQYYTNSATADKLYGTYAPSIIICVSVYNAIKSGELQPTSTTEQTQITQGN